MKTITTTNPDPTVEELVAMREQAKTQRKERLLFQPERAKEMAKLRFVEGLTYQAIGDRYGLTRERVRQIINDL